MTEELVELLVNILVNGMDYFMIYNLCCSLIEKRVLFSIRVVLVGVLWGIVMGVFANFLDADIFKLLFLVSVLILITLISRKKIHDVLILYVIINICIVFVQVLCMLILKNIVLSDAYYALLSQIGALLIVVILCKKAPLYKLLNMVERKILVKLFFFLLTGMFLGIYSYLNFDYLKLVPYLLYFLIFIAITFFGFCITFKKVFLYTNQAPIQLHDMGNVLMGIYISANGTSDINVVRADLNNYLKIMKVNVKVENIDVDECEKNIASFIEHKKFKSTKKLIFMTDIRYYESNANVSFPAIIYMLGLLLDNAIEASRTDKAIMIRVRVAENNVEISVANEYKRQSVDDFDKMFQEGYSTKSTHSRGYGLPNLSRIVTEYGGEMLLKYEYNKEQKSDYLTFQIEIRK